MGNERLVKRVYDSKVRGVRRRGRPRKSWMNGVNETLGRKGLNIQEAKDSVQYRIGCCSICRGVVCRAVVISSAGLYEAIRWLVVEGQPRWVYHQKHRPAF